MNRIGLAGLVASFLLLLIGFGFVVWSLNANERADSLVTHTYEVKSTISAAGRDLERAEAARRGYLLDPNESRLDVFEESIARLRAEFGQLRVLTSDNPQQQARLRKLQPYVESHIADMRETIALTKAGRMSEALNQFNVRGGREAMRRIRAVNDELEQYEDILLTERLGAGRRSMGTIQLLLTLVGLMLLVASLGTVLILRRYTRDLIASRTRLHVLNTDLEGAVAKRTADLTRANEEIQRFAYIVSHDLRSPLVNVLGFTAELESANKAIGALLDTLEKERPDLVTDEARFAMREDLPEAIGFIRSSTQKMDRLINAILTLSRQGRRVLTAERLPMDAVIGDVIVSLATLAEERRVDVGIEGTLPDIVHDRLAIEQIFQNLIENGIKYQDKDKPGRVVIRGERRGSRVRFEVEDNGRGIAAEDHRRIFELFRRSGAQDTSGEGIGLAHVQSLIYRLGGTIDVTSELGQGTTFIVNLPYEYREKGE